MKQRSRTIRLAAHICRLVMACTFIVSGFTKAIDPWGTAIKVNEYLSIYGFDSLKPWSMGFSIWLCGAELMIGCMLLLKVRIRLISIFALVSMIFFTILTFLSATWIPVEDCGCFGEAIKLTPWQTFFKNLVLLPMAAVVWYRYRPERVFAFSKREVVLTGCVFTFAMGLGFYCSRHLPLIDFLPYKVGVNIHEAMMAPDADGGDGAGESEMVLIYRNLASGELREFALEDPEWQDASKWEWVDTRIDEEAATVRPLISEFHLSDGGEDVTAEVLTTPGRLYILCVTSFDAVKPRAAVRLRGLVDRAVREGASILCITPEPLGGEGEPYHVFAGSRPVRCLNVDGSTMKTLLRAETGAVVLDDGTITAKMNWRDIPEN